jgi:Holliday junction resolvasome RuvABC endonuclease subunit
MPSHNTIVGIDVSLTNTGLAAIHWSDYSRQWETAGQFSTEFAGKFKDPVRQFEILGSIRGFCRLHKPEAVVIEDYAFGRATGKVFTRAELRGMILHFVVIGLGVPAYLVSPLALKRFMGCAGKKAKGDKDAMFAAASQKFKFVSADDNIVDAYCLARYLAANKDGQSLPLVRHDPLPQYRERVVQVPAPKKVSTETKNRLLTTLPGKPTVKPLRRIRL